MRNAAGKGIVRQLYVEVPNVEHQRIRDYAKSQGRSVQQVLAEWISPMMKMLPPAKLEVTQS